MIRGARRPARAAAGTAGVIVVLAILGPATIAAAHPHDANARRASAGLGTREASDGDGAALGREAEAETAGAIGGRFVTCSGPVASVRVSIEGRAHSALSGPTGAFELTDLPPGTFDVIVEAPGQKGTIPGIQVVSGRMTDVGEINLTDRAADVKHCGVCGGRCPLGASCVYGRCICPDGFTLCYDTCTTLADLDHCRACRNRCAAGPNMVPMCGVQDCMYQCAEGTADCDSRRTTGCETRTDRDVNNCGECGNVCAPNQRCVASRCQ